VWQYHILTFPEPPADKVQLIRFQKIQRLMNETHGDGPNISVVATRCRLAAVTSEDEPTEHLN
jgi:hypothetical protein